jgi:putative transposase
MWLTGRNQEKNGRLWGRSALDEQHLLAAARYIELNPVRAGLVTEPQEYRWSSCRAHLAGRDDKLVNVAPLLSITRYWRSFLSGPADHNAAELLRRHEHTGRPLGDEAFVTRLENAVQRALHRQKPGPKSKRG